MRLEETWGESLLPEDDDVPGPVAERPARPERDPRTVRRHRLVAAAAVVVVVAVAVLANVVEADRRRRLDAVLAAMPSVVPSLAEPLTARWDMPDGGLVAAAGDLLLRWDEGHAPVVRAVDADTGVERWAVPTGPGTPLDRCDGAVGHGTSTVVVCWRTDPVPDGTAEQPEDADASGTGPEAGPGATGSLVVLAGTDGSVVAEHPMTLPFLGPAFLDGDVVLADRRDGGLVVRRVDPVTRDVRWTRTVDVGRPVPADAPLAWLEVQDGFVVLQGRTTAVLSGADGTVLRTWSVADDVAWTYGAETPTLVQATRTGFGGWSRLVAGVRSADGAWYDTRGARVADLHGFLAEPATSDGSAPDVLLTFRPQRSLLAAVDLRDGHQRWVLPFAGGRVVLRAHGAVVVEDGARVAALDLRTGRERWSVPLPGLQPDLGALTDGHTVVVVTVHEQEFTLRALSVETGEQRWEEPAPVTPVVQEFVIPGANTPRLEALEGRPVLRTGQVLVRLG